MTSEYENEPVPGLPGTLPEGETLLWQGAPGFAPVARYVFHVGAVAAYFAALAALRLGSAFTSEEDLGSAAVGATWYLVIGCAVIGLLALLARQTARSTLYSITSRRVVMRYGMAVPMAVNIPFKIITDADLRTRGDGSGDIALSLSGDGRLAYLHLWPHARPWHLDHPKPMLRGLLAANEAANVLSKALSAAHPEGQRSVVRNVEPALAEPALAHPTALGAT